MLRKLYLSPLGWFISAVLRAISFFHKPFMVYGYYNRVDRSFQKRTRIGSNVKLLSKHRLDIKDNVWIGNNCLLDGLGGMVVEKGVNVASHSCIYTHSSQNALRLLGEKYMEVPAAERAAYVLEPVRIGEYSFVGTASVILPGTTIGKGCIIGAGSVVKGDFPDYSVIVGHPAKVVGDTRDIDAKLLQSGADFTHYYDPVLKEQLSQRISSPSSN